MTEISVRIPVTQNVSQVFNNNAQGSRQIRKRSKKQSLLGKVH